MFEVLKKAHANFVKEAGALREKANELRARESELLAEREAVLSRPLSRADYAQVLRMRIDHKADAERVAFARHFGMAARPNGSLPASVRFAEKLRKGGRAAEVMSANGFLHPYDFPVDSIPCDAAFFLFRDAIAKAATEAVEAIENWPWPDAVPLVDSMRRIDAIDAELLDVRVRASTLREQATELGIDVELPAPPEPEPEPVPVIRDHVPTRANSFMPVERQEGGKS